MKKTILLLAAVCFMTFILIDSCFAADGTATEEVLVQDSGNATSFTISGSVRTSVLSPLAETVKFTPPRPGWTLEKVEIVGWDGYIEGEPLPEEQIICLEIRDENLNLLYRFTDSQLPYFSAPGKLGITDIEIPSMTMNGDFYICFYDRGAVRLGVDWNEVSGNSYHFNTLTGELRPAEIAVEDSDDPLPVNWLIRAIGH